MKDSSGNWREPPPEYPCIETGGEPGLCLPIAQIHVSLIQACFVLFFFETGFLFVALTVLELAL
jgi:hypothetical protein